MTIEEGARKLYVLAEINIKRKDFKSALFNLESALKISPNFAEALSLLGYIHYKLKFKELSKEKVFSLSEKALKLNNKSPLIWFHMGNANSYLDKFDDAIKCYKTAIEIGLEDEKLCNNLGIAYFKKGDLKNAFVYFSKAIDKNPENVESLNNLGYYYLSSKKYQKASELFDKVIKLDANFFDVWNNYGNLFNELKEYDKALECYMKGFKIDPENSEILNNIGLNYYLEKKYYKATEYIKKAIFYSTTNPDFWINLGAIYSDILNNEKALECYNKAIELNPNTYRAWYNKGNLYQKNNDFENAINSFKKSIELNPLYDWAWLNLGNIYLTIKNFSEAENCYKKAAQLSSSPVIEYFNLGNLYRYQGKFIDAIKLFQKALELDPNYENAWANQGLTYLLLNDLDMAIICLKEAIEINPLNVDVWGNMGISYEGKKDFEKALECYLKVLDLDPNDILAINNIGHIYLNKGEIERSIGYFKKALEKNPNYVIALDNLGFAYFFKADYDKSVELYSIAKDIFPYSPEIWINLGIAYNQLGNFEFSVKCLNKAIELNPNDFFGHINLGIIFLNKFEYSQALNEFNLAIDIIQEKYFDEQLSIVRDFKFLIENALKLKPKLESIDKKIKKLIFSTNIYDIIKITSKILDNFYNLNYKVDNKKLPRNTADILYAKFYSFLLLYQALTFKPININFLKAIKDVFSSKAEFIDFFYAIQKISDIINQLKGYQNIEELPDESKEIIINALKALESLNGKLSNVITGSIKGDLKPIVSPPANRYYEINTVEIQNFIKSKIRISLVQLNYDINNILPFQLNDKESVRKKIIKALEVANKDEIDIICFPELSFDKDFIEEAKNFNKLIIIGGSYYDEQNYNVCPVIIKGNIYPIFKINPSYFENEIVKGLSMKSGTEITIFQTMDKKFRFTVLICLDFIKECWYFVSGENEVDFLFAPCYNPARKKFQRVADDLCDIHHKDSGICNIVQKQEKFGGTCFICFENRNFFQYLERFGFKKNDDINYKIIEALDESMLIIDWEPVDIEIATTPNRFPKILRIGSKKFNGNEWEEVTY